MGACTESELGGSFKRWLDEDVRYIISSEEREAFVELATDEEREHFIQSFWARRDPTPDSATNEYMEEHYRRIAWANDRFASQGPGWQTDRGRTYITQGPPDEIESHPSGGQYRRPSSEGGGFTASHPFEVWRYSGDEAGGGDVFLEFEDPSGTGEYRLRTAPTTQ
jgi:GWxTD domain-containing protein